MYDVNYMRRELSRAIAELILETDKSHDASEVEKATLQVQRVTMKLSHGDEVNGVPGIRGLAE